jgi:hypothetical protein
LGFFKNFRVHERMNLQFRAEMFNIWNTVNFNSVDTTLGTGGFGQVTSTYDPRIMQLALKLTF